MNHDHDIVQLTRQFLRINTTNPPGNEEEAVLFLEAILKKEGIGSTVFSPSSGRANIMARIEGKRKGKPVILLSHIDVVPASLDEWEHDPFGGELVDGFVYGRGAIDMKTQAVCQLLAFIEYGKCGVTPQRDIIFLATCDEEVGGKYGVEYMLKKVPQLRNASFVLSEGGFIKESQGFSHAQVSVAEKKLSRFALKATGTGGHGSVPHKDSANEKIIKACARIISYEWPIRPTAVSSAYLHGIFKGEKKKGYTFKSIEEALKNKRFREALEAVPLYNAQLKNTVTPTILKGGERINVIPTQSSAHFDARLLPIQKRESFFRKIEKLAGRDVRVVREDESISEPTPSGYDNRYFRGMSAVIKTTERYDLAVLPYITTGATDLRYFRDLGITAYGFFPVTLSDDEILRMHGKNERISVENIHRGLSGVYEIVKFLGSQDAP
ncbi:MAG TPA: M20/M25/M40 family metallo-hydrolase [Syntrophorhabdaceae bacterium]|nr:M20/M25/M40 family metallo-hydrolase [Syntrophorhabdaceae bacterium]